MADMYVLSAHEGTDSLYNADKGAPKWLKIVQFGAIQGASFRFPQLLYMCRFSIVRPYKQQLGCKKLSRYNLFYLWRGLPCLAKDFGILSSHWLN